MMMSEKIGFVPARHKKEPKAGKAICSQIAGRFSSSLLQQAARLSVLYNFFRHTRLLLLLTLPSCASAAWREGFKDADTLHLVGEGHAEGEMPELQAKAMAQKAAVMDAVSHWPKYCPGHAPGEDLASFHVSNQKNWQYRCEAKSCRARVVIQKKNLRKNCSP